MFCNESEASFKWNYPIESIENNENIVFNFSGAEIVFNSFADERFAKLIFHFDLPKFKQLPHFKMPAFL